MELQIGSESRILEPGESITSFLPTSPIAPWPWEGTARALDVFSPIPGGLRGLVDRRRGRMKPSRNVHLVGGRPQRLHREIPSRLHLERASGLRTEGQSVAWKSTWNGPSSGPWRTRVSPTTGSSGGTWATSPASSSRSRGISGPSWPASFRASGTRPSPGSRGACASGGLALIAGIDAISAGCDFVLVAGVEVQTTVSAKEGADYLARARPLRDPAKLRSLHLPVSFRPPLQGLPGGLRRGGRRPGPGRGQSLCQCEPEPERPHAGRPFDSGGGFDSLRPEPPVPQSSRVPRLPEGERLLPGFGRSVRPGPWFRTGAWRRWSSLRSGTPFRSFPTGMPPLPWTRSRIR